MIRRGTRSGYALLFVLAAMAVVLTSVLVAALVTASTQTAIKRAQLLQRTFENNVRIKNLVLEAAADQYETSPAQATMDLNATIVNAVNGLQGVGNWGLVSHPSTSDFGQIKAFPDNPSPHAFSEVAAIQEYLTPDVYRLMGGSGAEWSPAGAYLFRRYDYSTADVQVQVRTVSFPILRPPSIGPASTQSRIAYWKTSDLRTDAYSTSSDTPESAGPGLAEDVSLITKYSPVTLGLAGDANNPGILPWSFRQKAEFFVYAPGYIFSTAGLRSYVSYCGLTHTYPLDGDLSSAPFGVPALDGLTVDGASPRSVQIDVAQLGQGHRQVGGGDYTFTRNAVVLAAETGGGSVTLIDSGGTTVPFVIVIMGSYDASLPPVQVTIGQSISRPVILILSHAHLVNQIGATSINGAVYLDADVDYSAGDALHVSSLVYYGRTAVSKGIGAITADLAIPSQIEPYAPRAVLPVAKF